VNTGYNTPKFIKVNFHSDDIGATMNVTEDILAAWKSGYIDGFSILANGEAIDKINKELKTFEQLSAKISTHLNLSEGNSLLRGNEVDLLVDKKGHFVHSFVSLLIHWIFSSTSAKNKLLNQIYLEWKSQIEIIGKLIAPRKIWQIDSHTHIHMLPFLFPIACRLAEENNINIVRISDEPFYYVNFLRDFTSRQFLINISKNLILKLFSISAKKMIRNHGLTQPPKIIGILYSGMMCYSSIHLGILNAKKRNIKELDVIVHIGRGHLDNSSRWQNTKHFARFYLSENRAHELKELVRFQKHWKSSQKS